MNIQIRSANRYREKLRPSNPVDLEFKLDERHIPGEFIWKDTRSSSPSVRDTDTADAAVTRKDLVRAWTARSMLFDISGVFTHNRLGGPVGWRKFWRGGHT
jgi:hypothetical protein